MTKPLCPSCRQRNVEVLGLVCHRCFVRLSVHDLWDIQRKILGLIEDDRGKVSRLPPATPVRRVDSPKPVEARPEPDYDDYIEPAKPSAYAFAKIKCLKCQWSGTVPGGHIECPGCGAELAQILAEAVA